MNRSEAMLRRSWPFSQARPPVSSGPAAQPPGKRQAADAESDSRQDTAGGQSRPDTPGRTWQAGRSSHADSRRDSAGRRKHSGTARRLHATTPSTESAARDDILSSSPPGIPGSPLEKGCCMSRTQDSTTDSALWIAHPGNQGRRIHYRSAPFPPSSSDPLGRPAWFYPNSKRVVVARPLGDRLPLVPDSGTPSIASPS